MSEVPPSVRVSARIYRLLLRLYPRSFRRDYGSEMMRLFEDIAGNAVDHRGWIGLVLTWCHILLDTATSASRERIADAQHGIHVIGRSLLRLRWQTVLLISLLVGIVLTPADLASMLVLGIPIFGAYICTANSLRLPGSIRTLLVSVGTLPLIIAIGLLAKPLQALAIAEDLFGLSPVTVFLVVPLTATALTIAATMTAVWIWTGEVRSHLINRW